MSQRDLIQLALFFVVLLLCTKPLALFMESVLEGKRNFLSPALGWLEKLLYRLGGIDPNEEQSWVKYARDLLIFSAVSAVFTYIVLRAQSLLPFNPQKIAPMVHHLAFNTAISFTTNTNWQSYGGETTLSYFSQMVGLTIHNYLSAAVGICVAIALIRGITRKESAGIGHFWADMVRSNLYILLPICLVYALFLISQGMIQNFSGYTEVVTLEGAKQMIAQGPVASQVAIKMLGTNGGGFFNANAAHPFENPTALANFFQILSIFLIPSALVYLLGHMTGNRKHGWSVWTAMALVFVTGVFITAYFEYQGNPNFTKLGCSSPLNMEGKETRFGIFNSALFAAVTTSASCGAVNAMHDSFTPLGGLIPLLNILLGEIVFGGVGAGLYGMLLFIILTVFISGLMVGRTPEYLGQKIESREVQFCMLAILAMALSILGFTAWGVLDPRGLAGLNNAGPHGLSEILYAYTSATGNNGSAFAGLTANTPFYDYTLAVAMWMGRFLMIIPMLGVAGSRGAQPTVGVGDASFPVHGGTFVALLVAVILIVGALTFVPALALGPIAEHFEMLRGTLY